MTIDLSVIITHCEESKSNSLILETAAPRFVRALNEAGDELDYAHFYPQESRIIAGVKTRAAFAPIRALGDKWSKAVWTESTGEIAMSYHAKIQGVEVTVNVSEVPPSCRIETEEVYVPAHNQIRRKIVCNHSRDEAAAFLASNQSA